VVADRPIGRWAATAGQIGLVATALASLGALTGWLLTADRWWLLALPAPAVAALLGLVNRSGDAGERRGAEAGWTSTGVLPEAEEWT
jgi:hypothetical protein